MLITIIVYYLFFCLIVVIHLLYVIIIRSELSALLDGNRELSAEFASIELTAFLNERADVMDIDISQVS